MPKCNLNLLGDDCFFGASEPAGLCAINQGEVCAFKDVADQGCEAVRELAARAGHTPGEPLESDDGGEDDEVQD